MTFCDSVRRVAAFTVLLMPAALCAQTIDVPRTATQQQVTQGEFKIFDAAHLSDRPYAFNNPKPVYPSTPRVQREFVMEYVYEYAMSTYSPEVALPVVSPVQAKRDTPEDALIAFFSAMRSGNYAGWLDCWAEDDRKKLLQEAKDLKYDEGFWKKIWAQALGQVKTVTLVDRVETEHYVILDVRLSGQSTTVIPTALKFKDSNWYVTNELSANPMLYRFKPTLAGTLNLVTPQPVARLDKEETHQTEAQQHFLDTHTTRTKTIETGR